MLMMKTGDTQHIRYLFCFVLAAVAQTSQGRPRAAAAAADRLTHRSERLKRAPVDSVRQFLAAHLPPPRMRPIVDRARAQHLGAARYEGTPDAHLNRTAAFGRRQRPLTQIRLGWVAHFIPDLAQLPVIFSFSDCSTTCPRLSQGPWFGASGIRIGGRRSRRCAELGRRLPNCVVGQ
jgi:hypothetical protein